MVIVAGKSGNGKLAANRLSQQPRAKLHCLQGHPLQKRRTGLALWVALFATSKECADKDRSSDGVPAGTQLSVTHAYR